MFNDFIEIIKKIIASVNRRVILISVIAALFIWFLVCLPKPLFNDSHSIALNDCNGVLLSSKIATDGQWRFPETNTLNEKFVTSILAFEDFYFYRHPGINPISIFRALKQNNNAGKIVSGGSTITMQLTRLMRKNRKRTYYEKLIELIWALRVELTYSKKDILNSYASHAPFGSNVVGINAAAWRYFGRSQDHLSWAECATLAVLPNSPSLIYPGKNQFKLKQKRDKLLFKLYALNEIDKETYLLALDEPLPQKPFSLPNNSRHLLNRAVNDFKEGNIFNTTINYELQQDALNIISKHANNLKQNEIHNVCALVIDINKNEVVSYIGNTPLKSHNELHGEDVDVIISKRSTGSLLKPYLYSFMINDGELLPNMLIPDIPTQIAGYIPQNFNYTYDGAVPAKQALSRSLNIPAVKMLQNYTVPRFLKRLNQMGLNTINRSADDYGLSLILGSGESTLWDMCSVYSSMARVLNRYSKTKVYNEADWNKPHYLKETKDRSVSDINTQLPSLLSASAIYLTFDAMAEVNRPDIDASWQRLGNAHKIAWKTGTSFGFRDGWAIGVSANYVVGVWVGNADGEGRPGLTGISAAAPILFELFGILPKLNWFKTPINDFKSVVVCNQSGCLASQYCPDTKNEFIPKQSNNSILCSYHKLIHTDLTMRYRVTESCLSPLEMKAIPWFVLPPVQAHYYSIKNPTYLSLPPYKDGCAPETERTMEMIYPKSGTIIYIPKELNGSQGKTVFEVAHLNASQTIFWHLDGSYIGSTTDIHQLAFNPTKGKHVLTVTDDMGQTLTVLFEVISDKK